MSFFRSGKSLKRAIIAAVLVLVAVLYVVSISSLASNAKKNTAKPAAPSEAPTTVSSSGTAAEAPAASPDASPADEQTPDSSVKDDAPKADDGKSDAAKPDTAQASTQKAAVSATPNFTKSVKASPYEPYQFDNLVEYNGVVEHIFFHPVIAYPELAFDGDAKEAGIDDWMVTVSEYNKILQALYDKDYILVNMNDVWSEYTNDAGEPRMQRNTLMIPEGKKPLIFSYDDVNYYEYMLSNGFTYKLIIGDDGDIWSWGLDPQGNEVVSQDLDAITILDKFVKEHPDFSLNGAKGCLCLTGYEGILGYRTNTDVNNTTAAFEENRQAEREAVKPVIERLKETGWYFGSHTWGHINLSKHGLESVKTDTEKWFDEVGSLIGETQLLFYPHGARPDGDDVAKTGPVFQYLQSKGFRVFASVGIESYSKVKSDISAVICDRLHPDGTTLRYSRERYLKFYDAKDIYDYSVRPNFGNSW